MRKVRTQLTALAAVVLALAAASSLKRRPDTGPTQSSRGCCPSVLMPTGSVAAKADPTPEALTGAKGDTVIAYYFHATSHCDTCLRIEAVARHVVEQQFAADLAAGRLVWKSINHDLPENHHFLTDSKLPCPSLVLSRQQAGTPERWKLLADTWQRVHEPAQLTNYVQTEVRTFLDGQSQQNSSNPTPVSYPANPM